MILSTALALATAGSISSASTEPILLRCKETDAWTWDFLVRPQDHMVLLILGDLPSEAMAYDDSNQIVIEADRRNDTLTSFSHLTVNRFTLDFMYVTKSPDTQGKQRVARGRCTALPRQF